MKNKSYEFLVEKLIIVFGDNFFLLQGTVLLEYLSTKWRYWNERRKMMKNMNIKIREMKSNILEILLRFSENVSGCWFFSVLLFVLEVVFHLSFQCISSI